MHLESHGNTISPLLDIRSARNQRPKRSRVRRAALTGSSATRDETRRKLRTRKVRRRPPPPPRKFLHPIIPSTTFRRVCLLAVPIFPRRRRHRLPPGTRVLFKSRDQGPIVIARDLLSQGAGEEKLSADCGLERSPFPSPISGHSVLLTPGGGQVHPESAPLVSRELGWPGAWQPGKGQLSTRCRSPLQRASTL